MKRRSFLSILGLAPLAPAIVAVAPAAASAEASIIDKMALNAENAGRLLDEYRASKLIVNGAITADKVVCSSCVVNTGYFQEDGSFVWRMKDLASGKFV